MTENIGLIIAAATPLGLIGVWAYRQIKASGRKEVRHTIEAKFIYDMATNHLPHVYDALKLLCEKQGIVLPDPPPIRFVNVNGDDKS